MSIKHFMHTLLLLSITFLSACARESLTVKIDTIDTIDRIYMDVSPDAEEAQ